MTKRDKATGPRWLWWVAIGATAVVLLAAGSAAWYYLVGRTVWTDGRGLRVPDELANVRQVVWAQAEPVGRAVNSAGQEYEPALSPDAQTLYFVRGLPGEGADIYVSRRTEDGWSDPAPLGEVNTADDELGPRITPDGQWLLFYSDRPGGMGQYDLWASRRAEGRWTTPRNLGPAINSKYNEYSPAFTPDGRQMVFATNRKAAERAESAGGKVSWKATIRQGDIGDYDLFIADLPADRAVARQTQPASRPATQPATAPAAPTPPLQFAEARELENVNTPFHEGACCISPAGDFLYFASNRPGGLGGFDLYRCRLLDGRCGEPVNCGAELNTPANEMDPQLDMQGFYIYFSSDRQAAAAGYDLYHAESREVFARRSGREIPELSWSLWALMIAVAVLIPLLLLLHAAGYKHLDLLKKCIVVSLLIHIGLTMLLSLFFLSKPLLMHVAEVAGLTTAVNLEVGQEVQMRMRIRNQITNLPMTDLPVSDPTLAETVRARPAAVEPARPEEAELNVPHAEIKPTPITIQPEAPRPIKPAPPAQRVNLPAPPIRADTPTIRLATDAPLVEDERAPEAVPAPAPVADPTPPPTKAPAAVPQDVRIAPTPARLAVESLAEPHAAEPPAVPETVRVTPTPAPIVQADVTPSLPDLPADRVWQTATTAPAVDAVRIAAAPAATAAPKTAASTPTLSVPAADPAVKSLVAPAAVQTPTAPEAARLAPPPAAPIAPPVVAPSLPQLPGPRVAAAPATAPAVVAVQAPAARAATASPKGAASTSAMSVPTATPAARSMAIAAAAARPLAASAPLVAVDVPPAIDAPQIRLPTASADAPSAAEEAPPATPIGPPDPLRARPLAALPPKTAARPVPAEASVSPAKLTASSMLRPALASVGRPVDAEQPTDHAAPLAMVTPLSPLTGPGKLTSPDAFFQRSFEQRQKFVDAMGGSKESEKAVARSLAYLARHQLSDGQWPFRLGRRGGAQRDRGNTALTGLAVLCFLAADHTPAKPGPYRQVVRKGIDYLIARQRPDGDLRVGGTMYSHAIAALAVAEAGAMTGDPRYRAAAIKAGRFIVNSQNRRTGGWRYNPGDPGDTSVFGWQIMALHSIERVGMRMPKQTRELSFRWLSHVTRSRHRMLAGYTNASPRKAMSAEAVFSRILLGQKLSAAQVKELADYLDVPGERDRMYYYWYYGSLALMQIGGEPWQKWNVKVRDSLIRYQRGDGSWDQNRASNYGRRGGVIYATALSTLTLEVYYRYLPMYGGPVGDRDK